jgi:hypothetical protein
MLFTDPEYAQMACSPSTRILMFGRPFSVKEINDGYFMVWAMWLLFHVGVTLLWGYFLVFNSSPSVHPVLSRQNTRSTVSSWIDWFPADRGRLGLLIGNCCAFFIAVLLLISSEVQASRLGNCILGGENSEWSFGYASFDFKLSIC